MVKDVIKVSTVAFNAKWGDKEKNLNRMKGYIEAAASEGANLIVFPEMALTGYDDEEDKSKPDKMQSKLAEVVPGPSSEAIAELTKKLGVYVAFGMPERDEKELSELTEKFICHIRNHTGLQGEQSHLYLIHPGDLLVLPYAMIHIVFRSLCAIMQLRAAACISTVRHLPSATESLLVQQHLKLAA